jgi:hypothetical protein
MRTDDAGPPPSPALAPTEVRLDLLTPKASRPTPTWLLEAEVGLCPCSCIGKRRKGSFVDKTLSDGAALLRRAVFSDDVARAPGLLQRLDARVEVIGLVGLPVAAALVRTIPVLIAFYPATLGCWSRSTSSAAVVPTTVPAGRSDVGSVRPRCTWTRRCR